MTLLAVVLTVAAMVAHQWAEGERQLQELRNRRDELRREVERLERERTK